MVQHMLNDIDPEVLKTTLVNFFIYGNDASPSRQPPQPRRSQERAQKHRLPVGRRCFCTHAVVTTRYRTTARAR